MLDALAPPVCTACAAPGAALCAACATALVPAADRPPPPGLDACAALVTHDGAGRDLVIGVKYRNRRAAVGPLGPALADLAGQLLAPVTGRALAVVTWAPTSAARRRRRGYDQAELLARSTGRASGLPVRRLLRRVPGPEQTGADRAARLVAPHFRPRRAAPPIVVLIDDVWTTGATLSAAADALRLGGAVTVVGVVLAGRD